MKNNYWFQVFWNITQSFSKIGGKLRAKFESILGIGLSKTNRGLPILDKVAIKKAILVYKYPPLELHCRSPGYHTIL